MKIELPDIHHDQPGFAALVDLVAKTNDCFGDDIDIDMVATSWFAADMCAAFGV